MRIHSDILTSKDLDTAASAAGVAFTVKREHASRKRARAFEVILTGSSFRPQNHGTDKAATWDEWGVFFANLYSVDANALMGAAYENSEHFRWATSTRFDGLQTPEDTHKQHKWDFSGVSAAGGYSVFDCKKCDAQMRSLRGATWAEIA